MKILYFGKPFSFTHIVAKKRFGPKHQYISKLTIIDIIDDLIKSRLYDTIGVVPAENTQAGMVYDTVDILVNDKFHKSNLAIQEELELSVKIYLLGHSKNLNNVKKVYSHEYPIKFFYDWIKTHLPNAVIIKLSSTSEAAYHIRNEKNSVALASKEAAEYYKIKILKRIQETDKKNITKFYVISNKNFPRKIFKQLPAEKTSVVFSVKDKPGALCDVLTILKNKGINLSRIISRPHPKEIWQYVFLIEIDGGLHNIKVIQALDELKKHTMSIYTIGSYYTLKF